MTNSYDQTKKLKKLLIIYFFECDNKSTITTSLRKLVVDELFSSLNSNETNLKNVLNGMMLPEVMANLIAKSDTEYANVQAVIKKII
ncbi:MAG: hypothetical protein L6U99_07345 [Clostridium sp.]|nr:MAG: hypothetical protein L6U99_07345 [Clostridium sp.]